MQKNEEQYDKIPTINSLTGLRGIAALSVVFCHLFDLLQIKTINLFGINIAPIFTGDFGVDIFFVLSGFTVFLPCAFAMKHRLKISWYAFYIRRIARLFPAYYLNLLFVIVVFYKLHPIDVEITELSKHIFLLQNFPPSGSTKIMGVYWTLPVEFNFYLSVPLLFLLISRIGIRISVLIGIFIAIIWRHVTSVYCGDNGGIVGCPLYYQLFGVFDTFIIGIFIAISFVNFDIKSDLYARIKKCDWLLITLGIISVIFCILSGGAGLFQHSFNTIFATSIGLLIFFLSFQGKFGVMLLANRTMVFLGTISYGIYLWHCIVFQLLLDSRTYFPWINNIGVFEAIIIGLSATILVASISYYLIEKPFINLAKRHSKNMIGKYKCSQE